MRKPDLWMNAYAGNGGSRGYGALWKSRGECVLLASDFNRRIGIWRVHLKETHRA